MIKQINVAMLVVDEQVCADEWSGVVRREDVRATEKEKVIVGESFRVGDLVRAEVVSHVIWGVKPFITTTSFPLVLASEATGER